MSAEHLPQPATTSPTRLLLTPREAAKALSICEKTLWTLDKTCELPAVRIGRSVRYDVADLQAFIDRQKGAPSQESRNKSRRTALARSAASPTPAG